MNSHTAELSEARRRAEAVRSLRALRAGAVPAPAPPARDPAVEHCDFCATDLPGDHRHMLDLDQRAILCTCEPCLAMKAGRDGLRPVGTRTLKLDEFDMPEFVWAAFGLPVGLAFFLRSSGVGRVAALYPSPAGATECELELLDWDALVARNAVLETLETDVEALIVNRMVQPWSYAIVPIDQAYLLVGMIKARWQGISGGDAIESAVAEFFEGL